MKISAVSNAINSFSKKYVPSHKNNVAFKSIYVESSIDLGEVSADEEHTKFLPKDALLLNEISNLYPNQDCFIKRGHAGLPCLEYREKPPEIQNFSTNLFNQYNISMDPNDKNYPSEPLLLYKDDNLNRMIGMPSFISLNPSLPYTIQVGFELHKKLIEKKKQIMEIVGKTDGVALGEKTLIERAHEGIKDVEEAVKRFLLESAYLALSKRASASQIYASNYPKVQAEMDAKRTLDLTTSLAKQNELKAKIDQSVKEHDDVDIAKIDICDYALHQYPNYKENMDVNKKIQEFMSANGLIIS